MQVSVVFRCTSLIAGLIASLPLRIYRDDGNGGREEAKGHRLGSMLSQAPFPGRALTAYGWRELWGTHTLLYGDHFSAIRFDAAGRVRGFEPMPPRSVEVVRLSNDQNAYRWTKQDGTREDLPQDEVLHIPGIGFDGVRGLSRVAWAARNSIALGMVLEEQTGRVHENAARPSMAITVPSNVSKPGLQRMEAYFAEQYAGRVNAGKPIFLDAGSTLEQLQISPEDLGTLAHRAYQVRDICRFFGVPPHLVGEAADTSAWGSGIEQLTLGFFFATLNPELRRIEAELRHKLFTGTPFYPEFDRDETLVMDAKTRAEVTQTRINSAVVTPSEARAALRLPHIPGAADGLFLNGAMVPIEKAGQQKAAGPKEGADE